MGCPLDKLTTDPGVSSVQVMKQLESMIKSNITIIIILLAMIILLGFGLYYFSSSLISTLSKYYSRKEMNRTSNSESLKDKAADNEEYPEQSDPNNPDVEEDDMRIVVDPAKFMPKPKRDFNSLLKTRTTTRKRQSL
jgi:hypothetical protein